MAALTPMRVRGKRNATKEEKWHSGKQRRMMRNSSPASSEQSSNASSKSRSARSRRPQHSLSQLERLPTEILQIIFEFSSNVDLALASPRLAGQLKSCHLYNQLTSQTLNPVLGSRSGTATGAQLSATTRLMDSRFFTWEFFQEWLRNEFDRLALSEILDSDVGLESARTMNTRQRLEWIWYKLRSDTRLLPPKKLLRRPFTAEKVEFLSFIASSFRGDTDQLDPIYKELAQEGLEQAVHDGAAQALGSFWTLGIQPDTGLLRNAVIYSRCNQEVVRRLITHVLHLSSEPIDVDFLDPALWSWADKAKLAGDDKGPWLMALLRDAARDSGCRDMEIDRARYQAMVT